ncbi:DUF397 domain-containing protein [Actinomadura sp. NPDC049382]|uniref:DUF397 domain-containing protein n=1 Tax=Actinomadura sp. NPDC049382 TaxID=3158220 RepID=UPI00343E1ABA
MPFLFTFPATLAHRDPRSTVSTAQGADCVEVAQLSDGLAVHDSKNPAGPALTFAPDAWTALLKAIKTGAHDLP